MGSESLLSLWAFCVSPTTEWSRPLKVGPVPQEIVNHKHNESLSQSSIETIHKRRNRINSLLVCLSECLHLCSPTMPASCVLIGITNKYKILPLNI